MMSHSQTSTYLPLIYIQMSYTQGIEFHVISQRVCYVNIPACGLEVIPHVAVLSDKGTSTMGHKQKLPLIPPSSEWNTAMAFGN